MVICTRPECQTTAGCKCTTALRPPIYQRMPLVPTPRRLVDIIGANRPWLTFAQCMEIAQDVHAELISCADASSR